MATPFFQYLATSAVTNSLGATCVVTRSAPATWTSLPETAIDSASALRLPSVSGVATPSFQNLATGPFPSSVSYPAM